ncbi:MAG: endolytic transglycosylase MltG [Candidatus Sumerlaeaceae bacterium]|nr:endolytic transglycosylase MltG [Candidatus Sumerlaeaceae bacterium]
MSENNITETDALMGGSGPNGSGSPLAGKPAIESTPPEDEEIEVFWDEDEDEISGTDFAPNPAAAQAVTPASHEVGTADPIPEPATQPPAPKIIEITATPQVEVSTTETIESPAAVAPSIVTELPAATQETAAKAAAMGETTVENSPTEAVVATPSPAADEESLFRGIKSFLSQHLETDSGPLELGKPASAITPADAPPDASPVLPPLPSSVPANEAGAVVSAAAAGVATENLLSTPVSQPAGGGEPQAPQPFYEMPDQVPHIPHEDTEDSYRPAPRLRRRPKRRTILGTIANVLIWLTLVACFVLVGLGLLYFRYASDRLNNTQFDSNRLVVLTINPGDRFATVLDRMQEEGLLGNYMGVDDRNLMLYLSHMQGDSNKIKSGAYRLNTSMSLSEVYDRLIKGSQDFKITVPEGKTVKEIAAIVKRRNEDFDDQKFIELTSDSGFISGLGFGNLNSLEGYLYPSTYFFGPGMKEEELIKMMVKTFRETLEPKLKEVPNTTGLSFQDHIIMASLIEREARSDEDRPMIASVLYNRLAKDMPLQVDAAIQYANGDYSKPPTSADLKQDSPYNTYKNKGLPPGPICNPRLASILATFQPAQTDFLFYVHKGDGTHAFAKTFEEHKANVRLYLKSKTPPGMEEDMAAEPAKSNGSGAKPEKKRADKQ